MRLEKLRQVDLNLLITFAAIAEEKSITACSLFEGCSLAADRPSGGIDSAHASVSNKPRATNAAKHGWIQNPAKWFDRD
jgi:hypothetical protein